MTSVEQMEKQAIVLNQPDPFAPGLVAVAADEAGRFTRFALSMQALWLPPGSSTVWQVGNDIAGSRNAACAKLGPEHDWVWFIDDDHAFDYDLLHGLLARNVDIVGPLCLRRVQPFLPTATVDGDFMDITRYAPDELVEVQQTGSSGMLIRRRVLDAIEPPWFELETDVSEDIVFCRKACAAGFRIHVDMGQRLGHMTTAVIWPAHDAVPGEEEPRWHTSFHIADGAHVAIEPSRPGD